MLREDGAARPLTKHESGQLHLDEVHRRYVTMEGWWLYKHQRDVVGGWAEAAGMRTYSSPRVLEEMDQKTAYLSNLPPAFTGRLDQFHALSWKAV